MLILIVYLCSVIKASILSLETMAENVNVEQNVICQFTFNSNRLNFIEVEEIESEMCADKSFRTVVAAT